MSRSYKHTPRAGDKKNKFNKRLANRRLRRLIRNEDQVLNHKQYRKNFETWDICDYQDFDTFEGYYRFMVGQWYKWEWRYQDEPPTREECWKDFMKMYVRK